MFSFLKKLVYLVLLAVIFVCAVNFWLNNKKYTFSEDAVIRIAKKHINSKNDIGQVVEAIHKDFNAVYEQHMVPKEDLNFVFMTVGGLTAGAYILHASFTEAILVYGTEIELAGHSGRYWFNKTDIILDGELVEWKEGTHFAKTHRPGDVFRHLWGEVRIIGLKANTWKVTYARGFTPSAFPSMLARTMFGHQDYISLYHILRIMIKSTIQDLLHSIIV